MVALAALGISAGAALLGGLLNYQSSQKARQDTAAEREKIQALIDTLQTPGFSDADFTPEMYKVAAKYVPKEAKLIAEKDPTLVKGDSAEAKQGLAAQKAALSALMAKGQNGQTLETEMLMNQARQQASAENRINEASLRESLARQGAAPGSGQDIQMRMAANAQNAQATAQATQNAALELERQRLAALMQGAQLGGGIRQTEIGMETGNANTINDFNSRVANRANQVEQINVGNANDANKYNVGTEQRIADANVGLQNKAQEDRRNNKWQEYDAAANKVSLRAGQGANRISDIRSNQQDDAGMVSAVAGGVGTIANAASNAYTANEQAKTDAGLRQQKLDMDREYLNMLRNRNNV